MVISRPLWQLTYAANKLSKINVKIFGRIFQDLQGEVQPEKLLGRSS
jgi:hypothetical protein